MRASTASRCSPRLPWHPVPNARSARISSIPAVQKPVPSGMRVGRATPTARYSAPLHLPRFGPHPNERSDAPACTPRRARAKPASKPVRHFLHAAVPDRRRMRQYGCEQEGTKASSRRDADAARDARGRCAPRRPRPRARNVRGGRATRTHVSRSSRRNRSDVPRSHVTPARMPSCARCRSRTARVSRSIVSSRPCSWDGGR